MKKDFSRLDALLEEFANNSVPGCTCSIMQGDEVIYEGAAGYADIASGKKANGHSMFRQASTTKLFTYAILGMLYEEGKFLFSDPVGKYLPEWAETKMFVQRPDGTVDIVPTEKPLNIHDAVCMMCGLPYCMAPVANTSTPTLEAMSLRIAKLLENGTPNLRDEVRVMADVPVMFEPGTHWYYGFGSEITGALVETLTDKPLREVFRERVIEPLELADTDTFITPENKDRVVTNYRKYPDGKLEPAADIFDKSMYAENTPVGARPNLITSSTDFATFMQMLANGGVYKGRKLLGAGTVAMLHENQLNEAQMNDFTNDYLAGYGYGFGFRTLLTQKYGHNGHLGCFGWTGGSGIWVEADPVDKFSIAYMHNMMPNEELYHHHRVRTVAYGCML
ncbi:MAG: beta-lactamase family protein [Lachnospiraceae bacterium]|nr:beta-lactamase family protein [Lachnospiraceae bacterium]